ncbi:PP2C family protein-serine/threonine phosphatase [Streptomyces echinatus]|uniref:PP2C family protein-serine/threonine phosphatase n=1 Tax=Streptomyces echinatus TaxID=67293 RepID=UPI00378CDEED
MGDVCGKGTEAAKVTALARYTLRAEATQHLSPTAVLTQLNSALLAQRVGAGRFLTAVYATFRLTPAGVASRLCTAGHPPALIRRAGGRVQPLGRATDLPAPGSHTMPQLLSCAHDPQRRRCGTADSGVPPHRPAGHIGDLRWLTAGSSAPQPLRRRADHAVRCSAAGAGAASMAKTLPVRVSRSRRASG